jgi:3-hydroxy-3-methylglutaryl CoA synthase
VSQGVQGLDGAEPEAGRRALAVLVELQAGIAAADGARLSARERAIDGLRAIAQLEEYVAASLDEPGYYGRMAGTLRSSAQRRRLAAARLDTPTSRRPSLRTV